MSGRAGPPEVPVRVLLASLVHDVGKYVARTAHNVPAGGWTPELAAMLARDLFALAGGRASAVFAGLAAAVEKGGGPRSELDQARALLRTIDALEAGVRAGDGAACDGAAACALAVERCLRALCRTLAKESP